MFTSKHVFGQNIDEKFRIIKIKVLMICHRWMEGHLKLRYSPFKQLRILLGSSILISFVHFPLISFVN